MNAGQKTILAVALLTFFGKSKGSKMSRSIMDSSQLRKKFEKVNNGQTLNEYVSMITNDIFDFLLDKENWKTGNHPLYTLELNNLSGNPVKFMVIVNIIDPKDGLGQIVDTDNNLIGTNQYVETTLTKILNQQINPHIALDEYKTAIFKGLYGSGIYDDAPWDLVFITPNLTSQNLDLFIKTMNKFEQEIFHSISEVVFHEFFHSIDPEFYKRIEKKKGVKISSPFASNPMPYHLGRMERSTQAISIARELFTLFQESDDETRNLIGNMVYHKDFELLIMNSPQLINIFYADPRTKKDMDQLNEKIEEKTLSREEVRKELSRIIQESPLYKSESFKRWVKVIYNYFADRGVFE